MKVEVKILCVIDYHLEALGTFALLEAITLSLVQILYQLPIWTARVYWTSFDESGKKKKFNSVMTVTLLYSSIKALWLKP